MERGLLRALRLARLIVATDHSLRYIMRDIIPLRPRFDLACASVAKARGMRYESAEDEIFRQAYRMPLLLTKADRAYLLSHGRTV